MAHPKAASPAAAFDPYARPFVPEALKCINLLHGNLLTTPAAKDIDYGLLIPPGLSQFLPPAPSGASQAISSNGVPDSSGATSPTKPGDLTPGRYRPFFAAWLCREAAARQRQNELYSLYDHHATVVFGSHYSVFTIHVPGLRELTPLLEEDDVVEIRQLVCDPQGRVQGLNTWQSDPFMSQSWRGIVLQGRIGAMNRAGEIIKVNVSNFFPEHAGIYVQGTSFPLKVNVRFEYPSHLRIDPMRKVLPGTHLALQDSGSWIHSMLFPTEDKSSRQTTAFDPEVFSRAFCDTQLNWEQKKAVELICRQEYGELPFLISGPPGTGKTKTLIEVAMQLMQQPDNGVEHILVCAPSDPAADTLAERLRKFYQPTDLFRLNRPNRTFQEVPATILPYCCVMGEDFGIPSVPTLMRYRIVITTCRDASMLVEARVTNSDIYHIELGVHKTFHPLRLEREGMDSGSTTGRANLHWAALLIDEAAQAMEPEALIPLTVVTPPTSAGAQTFRPLFIMAGDQYQLGPDVSWHSSSEISKWQLPLSLSDKTTSSPLATSLFARLFARPAYADHPLARGRRPAEAPPELTRAMLPMPRAAFVDLVRNYRSHPAILAVPSRLFYRDTLVPEAAATQMQRLAGWNGWRGRRWPLLFRSSAGSVDVLEHDGGGWCNPEEARLAVGYAADLVRSGQMAARDICVMSPFKAQVRMLRKAMREYRGAPLWDVNVGPTEAFQGLESPVVILCTTRARLKYLDKDIERGWGIIGLPPNILNVALTRAMCGLIVIGVREVLETDESWAAVLAFCDRNGLLHGERENHQSSASGHRPGGKVTRLESLLLNNHELDG